VELLANLKAIVIAISVSEGRILRFTVRFLQGEWVRVRYLGET
jgi:hypothetical protein